MAHIIGIGTDIIQIKRIAIIQKRFGEKFIKRIFTPYEQECAQNLTPPVQEAFYAKRYAAKEAFVKALGCGISALATWQEIEVVKDSKGAPSLRIIGKTAQTLHQKAKNPQIHLTLSDDSYACAFVIIEDLE